MPSNQELQFACDRALAGIGEVKAHAIQRPRANRQDRKGADGLTRRPCRRRAASTTSIGCARPKIAPIVLRPFARESRTNGSRT